MFSYRPIRTSALAIVALATAACSTSSFVQTGSGGAVTGGATDANASRQPYAATVRRSPRPLTGRSWFATVPSDQSLLYVSDSNADAIVAYTFPGGKQVGTITKLGYPRGMCVDAKQNIWVTVAANSQIVQFAHGGTKPIATLSDAGNSPLGCAVDPKTGDLAVSNINSNSGGPGSVTIYAGATGSGQNYSPASFANVDFLTYDQNENLYFDGQDSDGGFLLARLTKGTTYPITVLGPQIYFPGGVQFTNKMLAVGDQKTGPGYSIVYMMTTTGRVQKEASLLASGDCVQFFIAASKLVCPNAGGPNVQLYAWPQGNEPIKTLSGTFQLPIGSVVSK